MFFLVPLCLQWVFESFWIHLFRCIFVILVIFSSNLRLVGPHLSFNYVVLLCIGFQKEMMLATPIFWNIHFTVMVSYLCFFNSNNNWLLLLFYDLWTFWTRYSYRIYELLYYLNSLLLFNQSRFFSWWKTKTENEFSQWIWLFPIKLATDLTTYLLSFPFSPIRI